MSSLSACTPQATGEFKQTNAQAIMGGQNVSPEDRFSAKVIYLAIGVEKMKTPFGFTFKTKSTCTATAITNQLLITAAHCVANLRPEEVYALLTTNPWNHSLNLNEWVGVEKIQIHEAYRYVKNPTEIENDLALLKLSRVLPAERVSVIARPQFTTTQKLSLMAVGYGSTSALATGDNDQNSSEQIDKQKTLLNYVVKTVAEYQLEAKTFEVNQADFKGVCNGDSGGPGFVYDKATNDFYILGLTSFVALTETEMNQRNPEAIYNNCVGQAHYTNLLAPVYQRWLKQAVNDLR